MAAPRVSTGGGTSVSVDGQMFSMVLLVGLLLLELKDKLLARHELEAGRSVQRALMPDRCPSLAGWDVWLYTRPANDVGGDLVDCLELGPGAWPSPSPTWPGRPCRRRC